MHLCIKKVYKYFSFILEIDIIFVHHFKIRCYEMEYSKSNKTFSLDVIALKVNEIYSNNDTNKLFVTK